MRKISRKLALFLAVLTVSAALSGCTGGNETQTPGTSTDVSSSSEPVYGGEISVGIAQDLDSLDPHNMEAAGTREVLFNVFEGLVKPDSEGNLIPAVASDYAISESGDAFVFTLRDGVKFHNGQEVTAGDVVYSLNRCAGLLDSGGEPLIEAFSAVKSVEAMDENTVVVTTHEQDLDFLAYLTAAIIPEGYEDSATAPIGTGPFKFVSRSAQENLIIEKFEDYWGDGAYLDRVTYKIYENSDTLIMALKSGAINLCAHLTSTETAELTESYNILNGTMNLVQAVYLNNAAEPFNNEKVRQALSYAIDKRQVMDFLSDGMGEAVGSSMYPAFKKYFVSELTDYYTLDTEKAKSLLAEAGYPDGFSMEITVPSNYQPHVDTAQIVVEQLKAIGVTATIIPVEWETWLNDVYSGRNFQSTIIGLDAKAMTARAMLARFVSGDSSNFINFSDEEYDQIFAQALLETDDDKRTELYKQLQTILTERAANLYIQDICDLVAIDKKLGGFEFYPLYVIDMSCIYYMGSDAA